MVNLEGTYTTKKKGSYKIHMLFSEGLKLILGHHKHKIFIVRTGLA